MFWRMVGLCIVLGLAVMAFYQIDTATPDQPSAGNVSKLTGQALKIRQEHDQAYKDATGGL